MCGCLKMWLADFKEFITTIYFLITSTVPLKSFIGLGERLGSKKSSECVLRGQGGEETEIGRGAQGVTGCWCSRFEYFILLFF